MNNLLPDSFVLALEHILELHKGVSIVKVDLLSPFFKLRDCFVNSKLNAKFSTVLVDFGLDFVSRVTTLQFAMCRSWVAWFSCPMSFQRQNGRFLTNRGHATGSSTISLIPKMVFSCFPGEGLAYPF